MENIAYFIFFNFSRFFRHENANFYSRIHLFKITTVDFCSWEQLTEIESSESIFAFTFFDLCKLVTE